MRSVKILIAAGAASLLSGAAMAADIPVAPPPQYYAPPPVEDFGGWYLRGDIGMTNTRGTLDSKIYSDPTITSLDHRGHGFDGGMLFGLGVGYQFNNWFRMDVTGEYRSRVGFSGTDFFTAPGWNIKNGSDTYNGGYKSWVGLVNAYVDLGTWNCITPFIGAGVGFANVQTTGIQDSGLFTDYNNGVTSASYFAEGASKTNLAWAVHAGLSYRVTNNFTVELAYRYLDMGTAAHGFGQAYNGTASQSTFQYRDMTSHDLKLGVRWTCCEVPPPPPPLITKG